MKRITVFLVSVFAFIIGLGLMVHFGDLQKPIPISDSLILTPDDDEDPVIDVSDYENPLAIRFSHKDTFYDKPIQVSLSCSDKNAIIYYTTNGDDPTIHSSVYIAPIEINANNEVTATTIKAMAVNGSETGDTAIKSYITGISVFDRFDEHTLVFVLSTDSYNLYDYYYGVAVPGYLRDKYLESDEYDGGEIPYNAPANWYIMGMESERDMYVEVYTSDGKQLISQAAGARVVGGYSRAADQKSWRLIARNSYSIDNGMFKFSFFDNATSQDGQLMWKYDRITLRNNANDREFAAVRDELSMTLAKQAGFPDTQEVRPAAVFLNSEYYGFAWLHEAYSDSYLEETYGGIKENYQRVKGSEQDIGGGEFAVNDFNQLIKLAQEGLTDDENFKEFTELVDIDNFIMYYAIQIYIDNKDWPNNNFAAWRYYPSEGETDLTEYHDGRWRFLLFDAEFAWGLYSNGYRDRTLTNVLQGTNHLGGDSLLLKAVLERDDMKEKFANTICDLIYGAFETENVNHTLDHLISISDNELMYALKNGYVSQWATPFSFSKSRDEIREFAKHRPSVVLKDIEQCFELDNSFYTITLKGSKGASAYLNTQEAKNGDTVKGKYFASYSVPVTAFMYDGYEFSHWEINGIEYYSETVNVTADMANDENEISIRLFVIETDSYADLLITEVYAGGDADWIELYNPTDKPVNTKGLFLSDTLENLQRWSFSGAIIKPKSTLIVVCANNNDSDAIMRFQTNFNIKPGETVYLSDASGTVLSKVRISYTTKDESISLMPDGIYQITQPSKGVYDS
jgi:hypothetical protein